PIQPEGTTRSIQEVDKVALELSSPDYFLGMGDFKTDYSSYRYSFFKRKVKGLTGRYIGDLAEIGAAGAVSEGTFNSVTIKGEERKQGPYIFSGKGGSGEGVVIIAGTENVFLNGQKMIRGEKHDYVIEYGNGQIFFNPSRLITADDIITVEYEYTDKAYLNRVAAASGSAFLNGLKINFSAIESKDEKGSPLGAEFSDSLENRLSLSGDSLVSDSLSGIRLPELGRAGTFSAYYSYSDIFDIKGEASVTERDRNLFSESSDSDNKGYAGFIEAKGKLGDLSGPGPGVFEMSVRYEDIKETFEPLTPIETGYDFGKKWGAEGIGVREPEGEFREGSFLYRPLRNAFFEFEGGRNLFGASDKINRYRIRGSGSDIRGADLSASREEILSDSPDNSSRVLRDEGNLSISLAGLRPGIGFYKEEYLRTVDTSKVLNTVLTDSYSLQYTDSPGIKTESFFSRRIDRRKENDNPESDSALSYTLSNSVNTSVYSALSANLSVINRWRFTDTDTVRNHLVNSEFMSDLMEGAVFQRLSYSLSSMVSQTFVDSFEYAGPGLGDYVYDAAFNEYRPDEIRGDYIYVTTKIDSTRSEFINKTALSYNLSLDAANLTGVRRGIISDLHSRSSFSAEHDKDPSLYGGVNACLPAFTAGQAGSDGDGSGEISYSQEFRLLPRNARYKSSLIFSGDFNFDYRNGMDERTMNRLYFRNETKVGDLWGFEFFSDNANIHRISNYYSGVYGGASVMQEYDIRNRSTGAVLYRDLFSGSFRAFGNGSAGRSTDLYSKRGADWYETGPGIRWNFSKTGTASSEYRYKNVLSDSEDIWYEMAGGSVPGTNRQWTAAVNMRTGKNMFFYFSYRGNLDDRMDKAVHRGTAEARVLF
ncbi:MAG: hypothetical protein ACLFQK_04750, partial [Fibrobacterota bacterium]